MRITIRLDDELLKEAKLVAAETGRSLTAVLEDALREALARRRRRVMLPTFKGGSLQPSVDLNDSAGLLGLMDRADAAF